MSSKKGNGKAKSNNNNPKQASTQKASVGQKRRVRQRRARQRSQAVDAVMHASGASGTDTRVPSREVKLVGMSSVCIPQQDPTMNVTVNFTQRSLAYLSAGIVIRAMQRGWLANTEKISLPYYAFRYLLDTFKNSIQGTFPTMQSAPLWFWELNAALLPKTERCKTGRVAYTPFFLDDGQGVDVAMNMGTDDYQYTIFWGVPSVSPPVNGYTVLEPPPAYTDENGEASVQQLFEFFENKGLCVRCGAPDATDLWMTHDTSSFAAVYAEMGQSFFNPSGSASTVQSERRITSPLFSKFVAYQDSDLLWRGWHEYHRTAGSPFYLGSRLTELYIHRQLRNKVSPIFKWFNFDEFFEVLSLTLCLALEQIIQAGSISIPVKPCPLTSQQVQLMLRQAILPFFNNGMAQDLRLTFPSWIPFLPFVVAPNGISQGQIGPGPLLPRFLAENIRSCMRIVAKLQNPRFNLNKRKGQPPMDSNMEIDICPVLGRPSRSVIPQLSQYTYNPADPQPLYAVDPAEVPINLIDASCVIGQNTFYLDLNGRTQQTYVASWNDWIQNYSGVLTGLVQLSSERGCEALTTLPYTNFVKVALNIGENAPAVSGLGKAGIGMSTMPTTYPASTTTGDSNKRVRKPSIKILGTDVAKLRKKVGAAPAPGSTIFQDSCVTDTVATLGFTSELWKYLSTWVLPTAMTYTNAFESSFTAYQTNVIEPFRLPASATSTVFGTDDTQILYPTLYERHLQFATMNVKAWNSPNKTEMEEEFEELTRSGEGGFFTKIAGMIGEGLGIRGSAQFMDSIGDVTGL